MPSKAPTSTHKVDRALAELLRGQSVDWAAIEAPDELVVERIHYHGIAGLLTGSRDLPAKVVAAVRHEALARAMWELRHRQRLVSTLEELALQNVWALLLKGTALAYSLYEEPATRIRGDTDLWVDECQLDRAREVLKGTGFSRMSEPETVAHMHFEEAWSWRGHGGTEHVVDLHWSAINSAALRTLLDFDRCWERREHLPKLGSGAFSLGWGDALILAAVHRQMHVSSPYMVDGHTFYGGERLIWLKDLDLLAQRLGPAELEATLTSAAELGTAKVVLDGLALTQARLRPELRLPSYQPPSSPHGRQVSAYLDGGQVRRAWLDLRQVPGTASKLSAARRRVLPSRAFLQAKYGSGEASSLPSLLLRRLWSFIRKRPERALR